MKEICHFVKELWPKKIGFQPNECRSFLALPTFWLGIYWKPTNQALMHKFGKIPKDAALTPVMKHNA